MRRGKGGKCSAFEARTPLYERVESRASEAGDVEPAASLGVVELGGDGALEVEIEGDGLEGLGHGGFGAPGLAKGVSFKGVSIMKQTPETVDLELEVDEEDGGIPAPIMFARSKTAPSGSLVTR